MKKIVVSLFFLLLAFGISAQDIWVSPDGNGSLFSRTSPGSLTNNALLKNRIKDLRNRGEHHIRVFLREGVYSLSSPIVVDDEMSGSATDTLSLIGIATHPDRSESKATLSGGRKVIGWQLFGDGIYRSQLPADADFRQLYVNGKMAVRARYPNRENDTDYGPYWRIQAFTNNAKGATISVDTSEFKHWSNMQEVELVLNQHWYQCRLKIKAVEMQGNQAVITGNLRTSNYGNNNSVYYWENSLDFLDIEREWYYDKQTRWLYYKPSSEEDITQAEIIYPVINRLFNIEGTVDAPVRNVYVQNIEFAYSNWTTPGINGIVATQAVQPRNGVPVETMIQIGYADKVQMTGCNIVCAGSNGVSFAYEVNNSAIIACHFDRIAATAIVIGKDAKTSITDSVFRDNRLAHNLIENFGMQYTNGMGLLANSVTRLIVEHNEVRFGRYGGMQIGNQYGEKITGLRDNRICHNNVHHVMWLHDDSGGIYTLARQDGTQICRNWVHDIARGKWAEDWPVAAIYLDNNSSYITVENNVLFSPPVGVEPVHEQQTNNKIKTHDNIIRNNESQNPDIITAAGPQMVPGVTLKRD